MPISAAAPQDFVTHFNYAKCMNGMMTDTIFNIPLTPTFTYDRTHTEKYLKLAKLTRSGIQSEYQACDDENEYSEVVAPWLPVKHYYRLYYLEAVLIHLTQGNSAVFLDGGHRKVRNMITSFSESGYVSSRLREAEKVLTIESAENHSIRAGQNITVNYYLTQDCIKSVRCKIANYVEEHWKINKGWARYSTASRRQERDVFKRNKKICLMDYFYQMRLKANYKDLDFLRFNEITSADAFEFIKMYNSAANKYANGLTRAIIDAAARRNINLSGLL